jgi:hypothetical protein
MAALIEQQDGCLDPTVSESLDTSSNNGKVQRRDAAERQGVISTLRAG